MCIFCRARFPSKKRLTHYNKVALWQYDSNSSNTILTRTNKSCNRLLTCDGTVCHCVCKTHNLWTFINECTVNAKDNVHAIFFFFWREFLICKFVGQQCGRHWWSKYWTETCYRLLGSSILCGWWRFCFCLRECFRSDVNCLYMLTCVHLCAAYKPRIGTKWSRKRKRNTTNEQASKQKKFSRISNNRNHAINYIKCTSTYSVNTAPSRWWHILLPHCSAVVVAIALSCFLPKHCA